jgi:hypothetical protein
VEYSAPDLTGKPALTDMSVVSRRLNSAAAKVGAHCMPFVIDDKPDAFTGQVRILMSERRSAP